MSNDNPTNPQANWPKTNGMTVPPGYFEDFAERMMAQIPEEPVAETPRPLTLWQRVRPYVYMAAMFAGIYLMLNIFTFTAGLRGDSAADSQPMLAEMVNDQTATYVDEYVSMSDYELYADLYEAGYEIPE